MYNNPIRDRRSSINQVCQQDAPQAPLGMMIKSPTRCLHTHPSATASRCLSSATSKQRNGLQSARLGPSRHRPGSACTLLRAHAHAALTRGGGVRLVDGWGNATQRPVGHSLVVVVAHSSVASPTHTHMQAMRELEGVHVAPSIRSQAARSHGMINQGYCAPSPPPPTHTPHAHAHAGPAPCKQCIKQGTKGQGCTLIAFVKCPKTQTALVGGVLDRAMSLGSHPSSINLINLNCSSSTWQHKGPLLERCMIQDTYIHAIHAIYVREVHLLQ